MQPRIGSLAFILSLFVVFPAAASPHQADIPTATGSGLQSLPALNPNSYDVTTFGASPNSNGVINQQAIDAAIRAAAQAGGGCVDALRSRAG